MGDSGKDNTRVRCVKEFRPDIGGNSYCVWPIKALNLDDLFDGADAGEKVVLEYCEMTQEELNSLPEFEGW